MHVFSTKMNGSRWKPSKDKMFSAATVASELRLNYVSLFYATETLM